uniref:Cleavage and polyadenylation specificity factor subunit 2 n=1 Tax=Blastobotrys adeninivorans TaxID=409370 RepID=A0A060T6A2_BLAAD
MLSFKALAPAGVAEDPKRGQLHQSVLSFPPNIKFLIDVGWDPNLSVDLTYLKTELSTVDVILLTHATTSHLGAYAYLYKMIPETMSTIPVYATLPVINMGRMVTMDMYRSKGLLGPFLESQVSVHDVERAFDNITPLKYSQPSPLTGKLNEFVITAYNAGHTLGGTIWKIQRDIEDVVYAVDWNHSRDTHLNGAFLQPDGKIIDALSRPSLMICGSKCSETETLKSRREAMFRDIHNTLDNGGTVLIPSSSGARVLELCHILDAYWSKARLSAPLIYFSHVGTRTLSYASSMLEWMSSSIIDEWQLKNNSPFDVKNLTVMSNIDQLRTLDGPKVIIASGEALEAGFSRGLFAEFCAKDSTTVILTEKAGNGTLSDQLFTFWDKERGGEQRSGDSSQCYQIASMLSLSYTTEHPLEGDDLAMYQHYVQQEKEKQNERERAELIERRSKQILEQEADEDESSSDESDVDDFNEISGKLDLEALLDKSAVYDYDVRTSNRQNVMYPYSQKRQRFDDYGEVIKPNDFVRATETDVAVPTGTLEDHSGGVNGGGEMEDDDDDDDNDGNGSGVKIGAKRKWETTGVESYGDETQKLDAMSRDAVPTGVKSVTEEVKVLCRVDFIDFEGLTNERSLNMILPDIRPKKLIMLPSELGSAVANELTKSLAGDISDIVVAEPNKSLGTSSGSMSYFVKVTSELESLLRWQKILGDYSVAHLTGKLRYQITEVKETEDTKEQQSGSEVKVDGAANGDSNDQSEEGNVNDETENGEATPAEVEKKQLVIGPLETALDIAAAPRLNPLMVGDIKLAELKKKLIAQGHKAEFRAAGILVCDDKVAVKKLAEGQLVIEGGVSPEFYETKNVVRSLLASV